jgi:hypothetical protein
MINPLAIATRYNLSQKVISLLETTFFLPDKDIVSIDIFYFFLKLNPAIRYNLLIAIAFKRIFTTIRARHSSIK